MGSGVKFGRTTITFVSVTQDLTALDRYKKPAKLRTGTDVPGCRFRPLPATETVDETGDKVADPWKATCPPVPAVLAAKANDEVVVDGVTYQIDGLPRVFNNATGPFKVTVTCRRDTA
ncbi:hypothetical protein SAMN02799620_02037 [Mycolicibacterium fluoranthenivorans]|uniref:Head-to-tail stopper n=1 Tax=Mycolicibacterium fluoranthenivorans TaxID=258505 RepID=A0A1G4W1Q9_9MYCO|nr:hypothetical protein SAMN02799620_02037 [Mycolicibacterium fluoranthenivorans]